MAAAPPPVTVVPPNTYMFPHLMHNDGIKLQPTATSSTATSSTDGVGVSLMANVTSERGVDNRPTWMANTTNTNTNTTTNTTTTTSDGDGMVEEEEEEEGVDTDASIATVR